MALFRFKRKKEIKKKEEKKEIRKEPSTIKIAEDKKGKKLSKKEPELISKILIKPLITEKATNLAVENKYVFVVARKANKIEVKKVIEGLYGVQVPKINIIKTKGKKLRYGRTEGRTKKTKKAIITLKPGEKIDIFEK